MNMRKKTETLLIQLRKEGYNYAFAMVGCIALTLFAWWLLRKRHELHKALFLLCVSTAAIVLVIGLTTTMIEVDARISSINFYLLGDSISFKNQVLFFQSKSIFDVVRILIDTGKYDSIIVGVLILSFSILFPVGKLFSAAAYVSSEKKWARNKFTSFFAFKSGKWSMADVMVVAILMTYIGFNGIVESQLKSLNIHTQTLTSITTNNTSLQPGYIVFVLFVLYGLFLSVMLKHITGKKQE